MNEEKIGKCLRQVEHICGHLWHRYSITVNQVMTVKLSKWWLQHNLWQELTLQSKTIDWLIDWLTYCCKSSKQYFSSHSEREQVQQYTIPNRKEEEMVQQENNFQLPLEKYGELCMDKQFSLL